MAMTKRSSTNYRSQWVEDGENSIKWICMNNTFELQAEQWENLVGAPYDYALYNQVIEPMSDCFSNFGWYHGHR